MFKDT